MRGYVPKASSDVPDQQMAEEYWIKKLSGADYSRIYSIRSLAMNRYERMTISIPQDLEHRVGTISKGDAKSKFVLFCAALAITHYSYTDSSDILINSPQFTGDPGSPGDSGPYDLRGKLFYRYRITKENSFSEVVGLAQSEFKNAWVYREYDWENFVQRSSGKINPNILNSIGLRVNGITYSGENDFDNEIIFDFIDDTRLVLIFDAAKFDPRLIRQYAGHFLRVLEHIVFSARKRIGELQLLSKEEEHDLVFRLNDTYQPLPDTPTIVDWLERACARYPDHIAVKTLNDELSFRDLKRHSDYLAQYLLDHYSFEEESIISLLLDRSEWMVISIAGILKAGYAFLPIDPNYPKERIEYLIRDSKSPLVLTDGHYESLPGSDNVLFVNDLEIKSVGNPINKAKANGLAYVIYTSGSTGQPKGVLVEHIGLTNHINWFTRCFAIQPDDSSILISSYSWDGSYSILWSSLVNGATLHIIPGERVVDPRSLLNYIKDFRITYLKVVPSFFAAMVGADQFEMNTEEWPLRLIVLGGEAVNVGHIRKYLTKYPQTLFANHYGPTEATIGATVQPITSDTFESFCELPVIGRPFDNCQVYILDEDRRLLPVGVAGEIWLGGIGIARGYLGKKELTAERFIKNPFRSEGVLYKTGDFGFWTFDGKIVFKGRRDFQVKVRGFRIEVGEIEHALQQYKPVVDARVMLGDLGEGGTDLIAFIKATEELDLIQLRSWLKNSLPDFMVPAEFIRVDNIPVTLNGKLDIDELNKHIRGRMATGAEYVPPRNKIESLLVDELGKMFSKSNISVKDDFFVLGGDSIKAILLSSRLRQNKYSVSIKDILSFPQIEALATRVKHAEEDGRNNDPVTGVVGLSPIQRRFFSGDPSGKEHYNQSIFLFTTGRIESKTLSEALKVIVGHHDSLRSTFIEGPDGWRQEIRGIGDCSILTEMYFESVPSWKEVMSDHCERMQSGMRLDEGPLLTCGLYHCPDGDRLLLIIHHLVVDGVSWRILLEDLSDLLAKKEKGEKLTLPAKTHSIRAWQEQQEKYSRSETLLAEASYWNRLQETGYRKLKKDYDYGVNLFGDQGKAGFSLGTDLTNILLTKSHFAYRTDINDVLLTALGLAVRDVFDIGEVPVLLEGHGREAIGVELDVSRTVGWFTIKYPVLLTIDEEDIGNCLVKVKEHLRRIPNKGIGYGILRELSQPGNPGSIGRLPEPEISFNYLGDFGSRPVSGDVGGGFEFCEDYQGRLQSEKLTRSELIAVSAIIVKGILRVTISFSKRQFSSATIGNLVGRYEERLADLIGRLGRATGQTLTPVDLSYKGLDPEKLRALNGSNAIEDIYSLSPLQEGLYYQWLSGISTDTYFEQVTYRIRDRNPDLTGLSLSFRYIIDRHPILRTHFVLNKETPLQVVEKYSANEVYFRDVSGDASFDIEKACEEDKRRAFDLNSGSQMRLSVFSMGAGEYYYIWSHHHIIMDGWCIGMIINDFYQAYQCFTESRKPELAKAPPYVRYIEWLEKIDQPLSLAYWKDYLKGFSVPTGIPSQRHSREAGAHETADFLLEGPDFAKVTRAGKLSGVTDHNFIQAVWGLLLSRYNDADDVVFGSVVSGRPAELEGIEHMIGLFINTIPVRMQMREGMTVRDLARNIQVQNINSLEHHYAQLARVLSSHELGNHLFDHIFVYQNYPTVDLARLVADLSSIEVLSTQVFEQTNYPLCVVVVPSPDNLRVRIFYDTNVYDSSYIQRVGSHFLQLLRMAAADLDGVLNEFSLPAELRPVEFRSEELRPAELRSEDRTFAGIFGRRARLTPDAIALAYESDSLTYGELNACANQLAHYLISLGLKKGAYVSILAEPGIEIVISLLGVLKAGGICIPIDPVSEGDRSAGDRINYILKDSRVSFLLLDKAGSRSLSSPFTGISIRLDSEWDKITLFPVSDPDRVIIPEDPAYVLYSAAEEAAELGKAAEKSDVPPAMSFGAGDSWILIGSVCSGACVWEIFGALSTGGRLIIPEKEVIKDPVLFRDVLVKERITVLTLRPNAFYFLEEELIHTDLPLSLRYILFSGESLHTTKLAAWKKKFPDCALFNVYGTTETGFITTCKKIEDKDIDSPVNNIGQPARGTWCYVADRRGKPLPHGVPGELYTGGDGLAKGRVYRTGDLVKRLDNGDIEYLGRVDSQLRVRGYRVNPFDIERVILEINSVRQCFVISVGGGPGNPPEEGGRLTAFVAVKGRFDRAGIFDHLEHRLPVEMMPHEVFEIPVIVPDSNGKTDRAITSHSAAHKNAIRRSDDLYGRHGLYGIDLENEIQGIWLDLLNAGLYGHTIGKDDDFFSVGGHSLLIIKLAVVYEERFNASLALKDLIRARTITKHARLIERNSNGQYQAIPIAETRDFYEVSEAQQRIWLQSKFRNASAAYNISAGFEVSGELDIDSFERAVGDIVRRHDALRTQFKENNESNIVQVVLPFELTPGFHLDMQDFRDSGSPAESVYDHLHSVSIEPFDLEKTPLFKVGLILTNDSKPILHYSIHHIVADGWSMGILERELMVLYASYKRKEDNPLEPLRIQYKDFSEWQRNRLMSRDTDNSRDYWLQKLAGELPVPDLPTVRQRPVVRTFNGRMINFQFDPAANDLLEQHSKQYEGTKFMAVLSVLYSVLSRYTGQSDILLGSPLTGREHGDLSGQVGFYVNIMPFRVKFEKGDTFKAVFEKVKETVLGALEHQAYPFNKLVDELKCYRDTSRSPLFDYVVTYSGYLEKMAAGTDDLQFKNIYPGADGVVLTKYDISFDFYEQGEQLCLAITYNEDLFDQNLITAIGHHILRLSGQLDPALSLPVAEIDFLSPEEKNIQLTGPGLKRDPATEESTIIDLFTRQVRQDPDQVAVIWQAERVSYGQLDKLSNQLAHFLVHKSLQKGDRVAILLPRGLDYIVAILGVLKAGGCYLPLDPNYPVERIRTCLQDSEARFLVSRHMAVAEGAVDIENNIVIDDNEEMRRCSPLPVGLPVNGGDLAYIIYTSGTTGQPKGVMIEHRNVVSLLNTIPTLFDIHPGDVWTLFHSYAFDFSVWEIFGALTTGGKVLMVPEAATKDPALLLDLIVREKVAVFCQTPSAFYRFIGHLQLTDPRPLPLRYVMFGGEALQPGKLNWWHTMYGYVRNVNMYGITETTVHVTFKEIGKQEIERDISSIGRPLPGQECFILDEYFHLLPPGAPGELFVGGSGVARGYYGKDELTGSRFLRRPFFKGGRLYRTGDKARFLENGEILYLGRVDDQIKIRGYRIEPAEVESAILKNEAVQSVKVLAMADGDGNELVAFYKSYSHFDGHSLKTFLGSRLPAYMIPTRFFQLEDMPVTANGKINKDLLLDLARQDPARKGDLVQPRNPLEEKLVKVWQSVLSVETIGVNQNFFDLGGHSLKAIRLQSEIHKQFGVKLSLEKFFHGPTIEELSDEIMDLQWISEGSPGGVESNTKVII